MANSSQSKVWNESVGSAWVEHAKHYDATLEPFGDAVIERLAIRSGERVLDVGCGTGATSIQLASIVAPAVVTGVDISAPMLDAARSRASHSGTTNVEFSQVDVDAAPFASHGFEVAFSRFGVMFFPDPVRAFTHIRAALVEDGRLGFVCFQAPPLNPFIVLPLGAAGAHLDLPAPPAPTEPSPFSLADPTRTKSILSDAGFKNIDIVPGPSEAVLGSSDDLPGLARRILEQNPTTGPALAAASSAARDAAIAASAESLVPYCAGGRVTLGSATWIVTATS